jgi:spermidine synthase
VGDVQKLLKKSQGCFDVIAMDVDNGPEGLTTSGNNRLYSNRGILVAQQALRPGGILAYWSAGPDQSFHDRLRLCGFMVEEIRVFAHGNKGPRHIIWLASLA